MLPPRVLVFAGSARKAALSKRVARAAHIALLEAGADATLIDLADYHAPLYHGDLEAEQGVPEVITRLMAVIDQHDALLIATPEYNGSMPPLLVNTLDWCSRIFAAPGRVAGLDILAQKPVAIVGSSPGALGGLRSLFHLRDLLGNLGMLVMPKQLAVGRSNEAVTSEGHLVDDHVRAAMLGVARALVDATAKLKA
ncbi:MAG: NADPH-dependent reductase [Betaproteobacteria bacterium]|nr:NADPH-dependent reductase [Betaproteobacteria bacterium]